MSLWKIAWRSIQQRSLASLLTSISMALGVALVATVLVIHAVVEQSFQRSAQGYDLVVGGKGGRLDLVLHTVYYFGRPLENIPYSYYEEFLPGGKFAPAIETAIPICAGDSYEGFPVIGTIPERFTKLKYLDGRSYEFAQGRNFQEDAPFEAVIGAQVARQTSLAPGGKLQPSHGLADKAKDAGPKHRAFDVVGVLAATGTPVDNAVYVNMEGFYQLEGHAHAAEEEPAPESQAGKATKPLAPGPSAAKGEGSKSPADHDHDADHEHDADHDHEHGHEGGKQVTAILVCSKPALVMSLARQVNGQSIAQAVSPAEVVSQLFQGIVGNVQKLLLVLAVLVIVVAGIGMMVSIYNSMNDRRREIAIMRALGARRYTVMLIILFESILLSLGGGALGLVLGHGLVGLLSPAILDYTGVVVQPWQFQPVEVLLVPGLVALAAAVGYLPALVAYRTDVARSLTK